MILDGLESTEYYDYMVDPTSVKQGIPAPDIFLKAASKLGLEPSECIGIEDAQSGVQAIKQAGMFSIGVGESNILKEANCCVPSTKHLTLVYILPLFHRLSS